MESETSTIDTLSFEDALRALETIVRQLESGDVPLEDSISLYEKGEKLRQHCQKRLDAAQAFELLEKAVPVRPLAARSRHRRARSKLINYAVPETNDERALNFPAPGKELNAWEKKENQNVAINSAKSIGCQVVNIGATDMINAASEHKEYLVLGLIWQIVKIQLMAKVDIKNHPEIASFGRVVAAAVGGGARGRL
jgi:exodeoxyribonuclease VII small subunit